MKKSKKCSHVVGLSPLVDREAALSVLEGYGFRSAAEVGEAYEKLRKKAIFDKEISPLVDAFSEGFSQSEACFK